MEQWFPLLINGVIVVLGAGIAVGCVAFGYWLGRNSIDRPYRSDYNPGKMDLEPLEDTIPADVFDTAMEDDDKDKRIETYKR